MTKTLAKQEQQKKTSALAGKGASSVLGDELLAMQPVEPAITKHKRKSDKPRKLSKKKDRLPKEAKEKKKKKKKDKPADTDTQQQELPVENEGPPERKKRRLKPGTKALQEIRKYQNGNKPSGIKRLSSKSKAYNYYRHISAGIRGDLRWSKRALEALHEASEAFLVDMHRESQNMAINLGKKKTASAKFLRYVAENNRGGYIDWHSRASAGKQEPAPGVSADSDVESDNDGKPQAA